MKNFIISTVLLISWELNAQVALPTYQGVHKALSLITLDFNVSGNLGLTLGPGGNMTWNSGGGGHLYLSLIHI